MKSSRYILTQSAGFWNVLMIDLAERGHVTGLLNALSRKGLSQRFDNHEDKQTEHLNETRSQAAK